MEEYIRRAEVEVERLQDQVLPRQDEHRVPVTGRVERRLDLGEVSTAGGIYRDCCRAGEAAEADDF